ncbi:MAG: hypothetical protein ACRDA5_06765 [Clostridium sp.]
MILAIELIILFIGIAVYLLQNKYRDGKKALRNKLVYWTVLLFMSITYNSLLFSVYPNSYEIEYYLNPVSVMVLIIVICVYIIIQILAPSKYIEMFKNLFRTKEEKNKAKELRKENKKKNSLAREKYFEIFLETSCWLGIIFTIVLEAYVTKFNGVFIEDLLGMSLINTVCIIMLFTLPVMLRQVIYYLMRIRDEKDEDTLTEIEKKLQSKLRVENFKL